MSSFQVKEYLNRIYSNVFLIAARGNIDIETAIRQSEEELNELYNKEDNDHIFEQSKCLVYLELLARHIRSSLIEVLYLRESDRDFILQELLDSIYTRDSDVNGIGNNMDSLVVKFSIPYSGYTMSFEKVNLTMPILYRLVLNRTNNQYHSEFFPKEVCVENSRSGHLGEFIERVLMKHQEKTTERNTLITQLMNISDGIGSKRQDDSPEDELVVYVDSDTRTIDILDQFEGYGEYKDSSPFKRIVISNPKYGELIGNKWIGYNLVIERSNFSEHVGDITFTEFKQKNNYELREHLKKEITPEIVETYLDKDKFYRFKKPYLLRAQNSSNRVGYGWQWDWSGGYGDYTEGTEYGETTNYVFAGAYITSSYTYNPKNRIRFNKNNEKTLDNGQYQIVPYKGVIGEITKNYTQEWYVLVGVNGSIKAYSSVYVDYESHKIYVQEKDYKLYNASFIQDKLVLHLRDGIEDKEIRLLPKIKAEPFSSKSTAHESKSEKALLNKPEAASNNLGINQKGSAIIDELVECLYEDTSTTELFDKFEGYGQIKPVAYQRIVIKNSKYRGLVSHRSTPGFNFVIERGNKLDHAGVMTMPELRQGKDKIFAKYISSEITGDIVAKYLDTDRFYRFSKPILLITQYGIRNGGKASEYYLVGAYISSAFVYEANTRKAFESTDNSVICNEVKKPLSNATVLSSEAEVKYSIRPYTGTVGSKTNNRTVSEYVLVKDEESSKGYIPVTVDDTDKTIYIYKPLYEENKDSLELDALQLYNINGTNTRKLLVSLATQKEGNKDTYTAEKAINHVDTYERLNDIGFGNDNHHGKNESDVTVKKQKATVIKVLKFGNLCPTCGKPNSTTNTINVIDTKGNSRLIIGTQCSCGTVYLTKKQYKKIHNKTYLEIYEVNAPSSIKPAKKKAVSINGSYSSVYNDNKMTPYRRGCKKCGKTPIAAGALSKGLQLCWECYKEEISSMFDY